MDKLGFVHHTSGFMSRDDNDSLRQLEGLFLYSNKHIYFIEQKNSQMWLTTDGGWTEEPLECLHFKTYPKAFTYAMKNKTKGFIITEHEFVQSARYETIEVEIPKGFMNVGVTYYHLVADTNDSANWDTIKFPLPDGNWTLYKTEGKIVTLRIKV